jgi:protein-S-isoprenylcysteine O-methyltransferase Ste14
MNRHRPRFRLPAHLVGFALLSAGWGFIAWVFVSNRFASSAVRIQDDRGQTVITTGPYARVRHPMYLGMLLIVAGAGPAVGSWWAGVTLLPIVPIFVRRTLIEDRMLHAELDGYRQYARRTRWKVVPGLF